MASILETAIQAVAAAVPAVVSMPYPYDYPGPHGFVPVGPYGGPGARTYRRSMGIDLPQPTDLLAMLGGTLTWLDAGTHVGPPRKRGTTSVVFRTSKPAILLTVDPGGIVQAHARGVLDALGSGSGDMSTPPYPLTPPAPHFLVYEDDQLALAPGLAPPRVAVFEGIPKDFGQPTDTFDDLSSSSLTGHLSTPERERWRSRLSEIAGLLDDDASLEARVVGHVDTREGEPPDLGSSRAEMFAEMIRELAISALGNRVRTSDRGTQELLYIGGAEDDESRRPNRRVEITVRRRIPGGAGEEPPLEPAPKVTAGTVIGHTPRYCSVTILDAAGRFHDPLDVVRRYDREERFRNAWMVNWGSPAVSSGWVRVITPPGAGADGVAIPDEAPFFSFRSLLPADPADSGGGVPLLTDADLDGVEAGDVVWLPEVREVQCTLTVRVPVTFLGQLPPEDLQLDESDPRPTFRAVAVPTFPVVADIGTPDPMDFDEAPPPPRAIAFRELDDPDGIGVRLVGLQFHGWLGGAVSVEGVPESPLDRSDGARPSVHVFGCHFEGNRAIHRTDGGGLLLGDCGGVLVEESTFRGNQGRHGGGLYAESCRHVVVQGRRLRAPSPDAPPGTFDAASEFERLRLLDTSLAGPGEDLLGSEIESNGLGRLVMRASFWSNIAWASGGGIALVNTRFHIFDVWFVGNGAGGIGGGVAASQSDPDVDAARGLARPGESWPRCDRSVIVRCVSNYDQAGGSGGGAFALVGQTDGFFLSAFGPSLAVDGARVQPSSVADGGFCRLQDNLILTANAFAWNEQGIYAPLASFGGGVLLAGGVYHLRGNRIHGNAAGRCGGGVGALAGAQVFLEDNLIDCNLTPTDLPEPGVAVRGGGALYAHGASHDVPTRVWLSGNRVQSNNRVRRSSEVGTFDAPIDGDGGAVLAVCGAVIVGRRAPGSTSNGFLHNTAAWNGGAIAIRNAELEIGPGEVFDDNVAQTGDGGALFVAGTRIGLLPAGVDRYEASIEAIVTPPGGGRGARLLVDGTVDEPVEFRENHAALEGGAVSVYQQPSSPILPPTPDGPRKTVVDRTVGLVRTVTIRHATFHRSSSDEELLASGAGAPLTGSALVFQDLDDDWRDLYDGVTYRTLAGEEIDAAEERTRWIGTEPLGQVELEDVRIELDEGFGILGIRSGGVAAAASDVSVTQVSGDPEGTSWARSAFVDVPRPSVR